MNWTKVTYDIRNSEICHFDGCDSHYLRVGEHDRANNYFIHYCLDGALHIKRSITANSMNEAKSKAVQMMQEYLNDNANYWNALVSLVNAEINN